MISTMLKPKTILILALVFCPLLEKGYAVNPVDMCRKGVSSVTHPFSISAEEREALTLTQNIMGRLKTVFLGEEIRGLSPELAERMDEVFDWEVRKKLASLTLTELRKVEEIVMRDRDFPDDGSVAGFAGVSVFVTEPLTPILRSFLIPTFLLIIPTEESH